MRQLARISLGMLGLALVAPSAAPAQDAPASIPSGYQAAAPATPVASPSGLDGKPMPAPAVEAPHKHRVKTLCAKCAAKMQAAKPPGVIVGCEHSKNGVCTACQAALNLPGEFKMASGQPAKIAAAPAEEAPGRAVASSGMAPATNAQMAASSRRAMAEEPMMAEPTPVGVVQANFSQGGPMMAPPAGYAPTNPMAMNPNAPGRAVAESNAGRDPYQAKSGFFPHPHVLGHLFGWSGIGNERADEKARRKAEAHAMISYENDAAASVTELPASTVFGKKGR